MQTIWKFQFNTTDEVNIKMPLGAEILTVQMQNGYPCLWAVVNPKNSLVDRNFSIHGTGHPLPMRGVGNYIGTYQQAEGALVWHLFED